MKDQQHNDQEYTIKSGVPVRQLKRYVGGSTEVIMHAQARPCHAHSSPVELSVSLSLRAPRNWSYASLLHFSTAAHLILGGVRISSLSMKRLQCLPQNLCSQGYNRLRVTWQAADRSAGQCPTKHGSWV